MSDAPEQIISDGEITRVHGFANFGSMSPREVVNDGVRKYAIGYTGGHTQLCILLEHGLITKPKPGKYGANLTVKGKRYARAVSENLRTALDAATARADEAIAEVHACGAEREAWKSRADAAEQLVAIYEAQAKTAREDRRMILEERDRTFALMLARAEEAESDARSWKAVALSNQAMAQSHCERWAKTEAALAELKGEPK